MHSQGEFDDYILQKLKLDTATSIISIRPNAAIGHKPDGKPLKVNYELVSEDWSKKALIIAKYQEVSGSTQDKLVYDFIKLGYVMDANPKITKSWLIIGGKGWDSGFIKFLKMELRDWVPRLDARLIFVPNISDLESVNFTDF